MLTSPQSSHLYICITNFLVLYLTGRWRHLTAANEWKGDLEVKDGLLHTLSEKAYLKRRCIEAHLPNVVTGEKAFRFEDFPWGRKQTRFLARLNFWRAMSPKHTWGYLLETLFDCGYGDLANSIDRRCAYSIDLRWVSLGSWSEKMKSFADHVLAGFRFNKIVRLLSANVERCLETPTHSNITVKIGLKRHHAGKKEIVGIRWYWLYMFWLNSETADVRECPLKGNLTQKWNFHSR